jgi:hypothetical protein
MLQSLCACFDLCQTKCKMYDIRLYARLNTLSTRSVLEEELGETAEFKNVQDKSDHAAKG